MRKYRQCDQRRKRSDESAAGSGGYSQRSRVKSHDFWPRAQRRKQNRVSFGALRNAGRKTGSLSEPCAMQGAKQGLFWSPAQRREQKRVSFGALRNAGSKKGSLLGPCATQGAKKGVFRGLAKSREQKRVSFGALRNAGSKTGSICLSPVGTFVGRMQYAPTRVHNLYAGWLYPLSTYKME